MLTKTKTIIKAGLAAAVLATSVVALPAVSQAAQADGSYQVAENWNHGGSWNHDGGWNHGGGDDWRWRHRYNGGWGNHRYGYGYRDYGYDNYGGAAVAGIIGLAAGAAIANSGDREYAGDALIRIKSGRENGALLVRRF
jgi:hypothetical protein